MTPTIFTVRAEDVARLDSKEAVEFFAELLWAEARRVGIPTSQVSVSIRINVPDGGVDASVDPSGISIIGDSFVVPGLSVFQIKAGTTFRPWQESEIRTELIGDKPPAKDNLGSSVKACLDAGGTYTLVCTGIDLVRSQELEATSHLKTLLQSCGYASPKVAVWGQNHLIGLLGRFPSLSLRLNGNAPGAYFQTHSTWSTQHEMQRPFKPGEAQRGFITSLQKELRRNDQAVHLRIRGEPGVGKTRLACEATAADDLKPLVIYSDHPAMLVESPLFVEFVRPDSPHSVILVVDECDMENMTRLWNQLLHQGSRIKLVSIYNDPDEPSGTTVTLDAPLLDIPQIIDIIAEYGVPKDQVHRWADFCDGSPRAAHLIGQNLRNNPEDLLRQPDTVNVWDRYLAGGDPLKSEAVGQRRTVLQHLALFKRFGYSGPVMAEAKAIAGLIEIADPQITWHRFQAIVMELRRRRILQGETTLYITPKLLHIKLWVDWWDAHGEGFALDEFVKDLPPTLVDWLIEMFRYARESRAALRVAESLLAENGPFGDPRFFGNRRAGRFFLTLTDAAPKAALRALQRAIGTWDTERLLKFEEGRREVVWSLERIAVWRHLFAEAAYILLKLAEAENERIANNASGVFADLFLPGYGSLAPTEASPEERFPVLRAALNSPSKRQREVALTACDHALEVLNFSRTIGAEYQGLRRPPQLWMPKTWGELFDAYRRVWALLVERLETLEPDERDKAIEVVLTHVRELLQIKPLFEMVTATLEALVDTPYVTHRRIVEVVEHVLHYDGKSLPVERRSRLEKLRARLVGTDFHSRLERYVGMDMIEDGFDESGKAVDKVGPVISSLAEDAVRTPALLAPELPWLVTEAAANGYRFGRELALRDSRFARLGMLLEAQRQATDNASAFFLGGYLSVLFERDRELWEKTLDDAAADTALLRYAPEFTWRSGITERAGLRLLALAESRAIPVTALQMFAYGGVVRGLPEHVFERWIDCLLNAQTRAAATSALSLMFFYYRMDEPRRPLPRPLTLRVLTAPPFFEDSAERKHQMEEFEWSQVADSFLDLYPEDGMAIADKLLERFGVDKTITGGFHSKAQDVLTKIVKQSPAAIWNAITARIGPPVDTRAFHITRWLRDGGLMFMPPEPVWAWINADIEERASYAASFVPPSLSRPEGGFSWARELLVRYGQSEDVRNSLQANFSTGVFTGPISSHYLGTRQGFEELRKSETDANVRRWLDEFIDTLSLRIENARIHEERDDF